MKLHRGEQGFTLIELVLAITLLAAMMAVLTGGFSLSLRSWEAGTDRMERHYDITEGIYLIAGRLREARAAHFISDKNVKTLAFVGNGGKAAFVTARPRLHRAADASGLYLQKVEYDAAKKAAVFSEAPFYPRTPPEELQFKSAIFGEGKITGLRFEYLVRDPETADEQYVWRGAVDYFTNPPAAGRGHEMPRAVRIAMAAPDGRGPFTLPEMTVYIMPGTELKKAAAK